MKIIIETVNGGTYEFFTDSNSIIKSLYNSIYDKSQFIEMPILKGKHYFLKRNIVGIIIKEE